MQFRKAVKEDSLNRGHGEPQVIVCNLFLSTVQLQLQVSHPLLACLLPLMRSLRDKAVTIKMRKQYVTMEWAKIKIHYSQSGLANFLRALFFPSLWLTDTTFCIFDSALHFPETFQLSHSNAVCKKHDKEFLKSLWKLGSHPSPLHMNGTTFIQSHNIVGCGGKGQKYQTFQSFWVPQCYAYIKFLGTWYFRRWEL